MRHLLVISSLLVFICSGCAGTSDTSLVDVEKQAFDDLRTEIRIAIDDEERMTRAIEIVDELAIELESLRRLKAEKQQHGRKLHADYDTTRAELDEFVNASNTAIRVNQQRILQMRTALIAATTPEEWKQIADARTDAISAAIKATQSI